MRDDQRRAMFANMFSGRNKFAADDDKKEVPVAESSEVKKQLGVSEEVKQPETVIEGPVSVPIVTNVIPEGSTSDDPSGGGFYNKSNVDEILSYKSEDTDYTPQVDVIRDFPSGETIIKGPADSMYKSGSGSDQTSDDRALYLLQKVDELMNQSGSGLNGEIPKPEINTGVPPKTEQIPLTKPDGSPFTDKDIFERQENERKRQEREENFRWEHQQDDLGGGRSGGDSGSGGGDSGSGGGSGGRSDFGSGGDYSNFDLNVLLLMAKIRAAEAAERYDSMRTERGYEEGPVSKEFMKAKLDAQLADEAYKKLQREAALAAAPSEEAARKVKAEMDRLNLEEMVDAAPSKEAARKVKAEMDRLNLKELAYQYSPWTKAGREVKSQIKELELLGLVALAPGAEAFGRTAGTGVSDLIGETKDLITGPQKEFWMPPGTQKFWTGSKYETRQVMRPPMEPWAYNKSLGMQMPMGVMPTVLGVMPAAASETPIYGGARGTSIFGKDDVSIFGKLEMAAGTTFVPKVNMPNFFEIPREVTQSWVMPPSEPAARQRSQSAYTGGGGFQGASSGTSSQSAYGGYGGGQRSSQTTAQRSAVTSGIYPVTSTIVDPIISPSMREFNQGQRASRMISKLPVERAKKNIVPTRMPGISSNVSRVENSKGVYDDMASSLGMDNPQVRAAEARMQSQADYASRHVEPGSYSESRLRDTGLFPSMG